MGLGKVGWDLVGKCGMGHKWVKCYAQRGACIWWVGVGLGGEERSGIGGRA